MKSKRKNSRSLSAYYMTTEEIAAKWNDEEYKIGDVFKKWTSKKVASKFKYIFIKLDIMEYLDCYKVNRGFDFSGCINDMERYISYFIEAEEYMSEDFEESSRDFIKSFEKLKECEVKEKESTKSGDFIFNKESFLEKEDQLKRVIEITEKKQIEKEEWVEMVECLIKLQPESNNPYMMKEIVLYKESEGKKTLKKFEIDHYIELQEKMKEMREVLIDKYMEYSFAWCFDLLDSYDENYEKILAMFEDVVKKYKYLVKNVKKIRMIEECLGNKETSISIDDIFKCGLFFESRKDADAIKNVRGSLSKRKAKGILENMISEFTKILYNEKLNENDVRQIRLKFMEEMKYANSIYDEMNNKNRTFIKQKCSEKGYGGKITEEDIDKYEWIVAIRKVNRSIG